jgi:hypothetical protein
MEATYDGLAAIGKAKASAFLIWTHLVCVPIAGVGLYIFSERDFFRAKSPESYPPSRAAARHPTMTPNVLSIFRSVYRVTQLTEPSNGW